MANLKIRVFKIGESKPQTTVTIPGGVMRLASRLIPKKVAQDLQEQGFDVREIVRLATSQKACGTILEVEQHREKQRVVIALE